jgi:hypothetical protein
VAEHREILACLVAGNAGRLQALMHNHLEAVLSRAIETASRDADRGIRHLLAPYAKTASVKRNPTSVRRKASGTGSAPRQRRRK